MQTMRFFNTAGPMKPAIHYCIPPLERLNAERVLGLIRQQKYFVLHAPRQTGKTSALLALQDELNASGQYRAVYVNVEAGQAAREDVAAAMQAILSELALAAEFVLDDLFVKNVRRAALEDSGPHGALRDMLSRWAAADAEPLVLLIDEIDALVGDTLVSVLRQLRAGYAHRPSRFPQSVVLCGIRDVRDYRIHASAEKAVITGGSAFNIKSESLRLGDFSAAETRAPARPAHRRNRAGVDRCGPGRDLAPDPRGSRGWSTPLPTAPARQAEITSGPSLSRRSMPCGSN